MFQKLEQVHFASDFDLPLHIQDPWLAQNVTDFTEITDGTHQVFLNQNEEFNDTDPIYRLRAPHIGDVTQSEIYVFDKWVGNTGEVDFGDAGARTTDVVFLSPGATVTAQYVDALAVALGRYFHL